MNNIFFVFTITFQNCNRVNHFFSYDLSLHINVKLSSRYCYILKGDHVLRVQSESKLVKGRFDETLTTNFHINQGYQNYFQTL